jgi:hypothetical protein
MRLLFILVLLTAITPACRQGASEEFPREVIMQVNYYRQRCQGEGTFNCLLVQQGQQIGSRNWELFYDQIQGFAYEPGYIYTLRVRIEQIPDPPQDGSDRRYTLVKTLSKRLARP